MYGRITSNLVGGTTINSYVFDNDGNLYQLTDKVAGLTTRYDYNDSDMVVRSAVYAGENTDSGNLESRMQYWTAAKSVDTFCDTICIERKEKYDEQNCKGINNNGIIGSALFLFVYLGLGRKL